MRVQKEREMDSIPSAGDPVGGTPAWQSLSDGLLAGFCHELGGRASAFASIAHLANRDSMRAGFVVGEIERESERLIRLANLLRVLPRHEGQGLRTTALEPSVTEALELARYHHGLRAIELESALGSDLPAVRVDRNLLMQSLLLLVAATARHAFGEGRDRVRVSGSRDGDTVIVRIEAPSGARQDWGLSPWLDTPPPTVDPTSLAAFRDRWARDGGALDALPDGGYRLALPITR